VQKLEQLLNEIRQKRNKYEFVKIQQAEKEKTMPMGKGTYGSTRGRPPKKKTGGGLTAKQKTLPKQLQQKIMKAKKKK
tara:strand:+ start:2617 stop:2850 length:234 start_codon:yes stop_codon:yes gene_type:complete